MSVDAVSSPPERRYPLGRIVSVSGSQAIVLMHSPDQDAGEPVMSVEMGTLLKVETQGSIVLGLVSALTVPMPSQDPTEPEMKSSGCSISTRVRNVPSPRMPRPTSSPTGPPMEKRWSFFPIAVVNISCGSPRWMAAI